MENRNQQGKAIPEKSNVSLWDTFTLIYCALFAAVGFALAIHIINAGSQQIPMWVLLSTGLMLFISVVLCMQSGNYTGITTGVIAFFGVFFMMWLIPNLSITPGNAPLDQMMMRILSLINYMPLLAGILGVVSSFANDSSKQK